MRAQKDQACKKMARKKLVNPWNVFYTDKPSIEEPCVYRRLFLNV